MATIKTTLPSTTPDIADPGPLELIELTFPGLVGAAESTGGLLGPLESTKNALQ